MRTLLAYILIAAAGGVLLAGCDKPDASADAGDDPGYAIVDDPMGTRVAAAEIYGSAEPANGHAADEPSDTPVVAIQGIRVRTRPGPRDDELPPVGTVDDFIARLAERGVTRLVRGGDTTTTLPGGDPVASAGPPPGDLHNPTPTPREIGPVPEGPGGPVELIGPQGEKPSAVVTDTWRDTPNGVRSAIDASGLPRLHMPRPGDNMSAPPPLMENSPAARLASAAPGGSTMATGRPTDDEPTITERMAERPVSGAVIQVGGRLITVDDVVRPILPELERLASELSPRGYQREAFDLIGAQLRGEISEELVLREAERGMTDETSAAVNQTVGQMIREQINKMFGGSEPLYRMELRRRGLNYEQEMTRQRRQLLVQSYLREKFMPQVHVTRPEAFRYYQDHLRDYTDEPKATVRLIQVDPKRWYPPTRSVNETERKLAERLAREYTGKVLAQIRAGQISFADAARKYSHGPMAADGGNWGPITPGGFRMKKVEDATFALRPGQTSDVIEDTIGDDGNVGYYIVLAETVEAVNVTPFSEAQRNVIPRLEREKLNQMSDQYMIKLFREAGLDDKKLNHFVQEAYRVAPKPGDN